MKTTIMTTITTIIKIKKNWFLKRLINNNNNKNNNKNNSNNNSNDSKRMIAPIPLTFGPWRPWMRGVMVHPSQSAVCK